MESLTIPDIVNKFDLVTGISDHTINNTTSIASIPLGVSIIEKHFTLNREGGGPDDVFSLEPKELKELCESSNIAWKSLGKIDYSRKSSEISNLKFRRSLYFIKDIKQGEKIKREHIKSIRPGYGVKPKYLENIIGLTVNSNIVAGFPVKKEHLNNADFIK